MRISVSVCCQSDVYKRQEQAEKVVKDLEKKSMTNKGRLEKYFAQVK